MTNQPIQVFFYGLFMDDNLLRSKGIVALNPRPAFVEGFGLRIGKRATLVPARDERSYGMLMGLTQQELERLYSAPGLEHYRPEPVTCTILTGAHVSTIAGEQISTPTDEQVSTLAGEQVSALCYNLSNAPAPEEANEEYARQLRALLSKLGFPTEYVERVR